MNHTSKGKAKGIVKSPEIRKMVEEQIKRKKAKQVLCDHLLGFFKGMKVRKILKSNKISDL